MPRAQARDIQGHEGEVLQVAVGRGEWRRKGGHLDGLHAAT
jgi:hypothetical protein